MIYGYMISKVFCWRYILQDIISQVVYVLMQVHCVTTTADKEYPSIAIREISSVNNITRWKHFIISDLKWEPGFRTNKEIWIMWWRSIRSFLDLKLRQLTTIRLQLPDKNLNLLESCSALHVLIVRRDINLSSTHLPVFVLYN